MIAVLTGSYEQYCQFLYVTRLTPLEASWVYLPEHVCGRDFHTVIRYGNWDHVHGAATLFAEVTERIERNNNQD